MSDDVIAELARRSNDRIETSEEFAEIREKIQEARDNDGMVHLSEILKERADAEANGDGDAENEEEEKEGDEPAPLTPQVEEALNVLSELIKVTRRGI